MKKILLFVLLASLTMPVVLVYAEDTGQPSPDSGVESQRAQKDECMLAAIHCGTSAMSIQDKIDRLEEDIAKGTKVYTKEELEVLRHKLEDVNKTLDFLMEQ